MLNVNEIVKEQMVQTTSKKIVRPSEKQKPCACVPHTPYVRNESFVRATACFAALFFDQLAEDVAFEMMDVPSFGTLFQTAFMIALAVFGLLDQLSGGIVAVGGDFAVPAGFLDQVVGLVVIETIGFAVFVGEDGQTAGFVVGIGEGMAQCVGAFERQSVHCEFVSGFG